VALIPQAFMLNVTDAAIADLHSRLSRTRLPDQAPIQPGPLVLTLDTYADCSHIGKTDLTGECRRQH
jgi:hypothetical protein